MPNVTINPTRDGRVSVTAQPLFLGAQGLASGSFVSANPSNSSPAFGVSFLAARGGGTNTALYRYFMYFDTSAYTTTITNPEIEVRGYGSYTNDQPVIVKAQNSSNGFQAFDGGSRDIAKQDYSRWSTNADDRYYSSPITFTSGWNAMALNDSASVAISESNAFCICILDAPHDYSARQPGVLPTSDLTGFWGGPNGGAYKIRLNFTSSTSGWSAGKFLGVGATSIDKIMGVDRTDISKVIGV